MKKKILLFVTLFVILLSLVIPTHASPTRLVDDADILTDIEELALLTQLDIVSESLSFDVAVVTTNNTNGLSVGEYADNFFDYNGYGYGENRDGVLLMIDMNSRNAWISTSGYGITAFTDAGIDYILDGFKQKLSDGEYSDACLTFVDSCEAFVNQAREGKPFDANNLPKDPFNFSKAIIISIVIGLIFGWIVVGNMKSKLKSVAFQRAAANYQRPGSLNLINSNDFFLYSKVDYTRKSSESSGGSSTHRSSSGRTHGGGGTSF